MNIKRVVYFCFVTLFIGLCGCSSKKIASSVEFVGYECDSKWEEYGGGMATYDGQVILSLEGCSVEHEFNAEVSIDVLASIEAANASLSLGYKVSTTDYYLSGSSETLNKGESATFYYKPIYRVFRLTYDVTGEIYTEAYNAQYAVIVRDAKNNIIKDTTDVEIDFPQKGYYASRSKISQKDNNESIYSKQQLKILGKVMVYGKLVGIEEEKTDEGTLYHISQIPFVDNNLSFAMFGNEKTLLKDGYICRIKIVSDRGDHRHELIDHNKDEIIPQLIDYTNTKDCLIGRMKNFNYDSSLEMKFAMPEEGIAQIYLELEGDKSGWYDVEITRINVSEKYDEVSFDFIDTKLPENFWLSSKSCMHGAPIIQNNKFVAVFSQETTLKNPSKPQNGEFHYYNAKIAADMRFAQLQKYDKNFNAELFRDVSTLKDYFD